MIVRHCLLLGWFLILFCWFWCWCNPGLGVVWSGWLLFLVVLFCCFFLVCMDGHWWRRPTYFLILHRIMMDCMTASCCDIFMIIALWWDHRRCQNDWLAISWWGALWVMDCFVWCDCLIAFVYCDFDEPWTLFSHMMLGFVFDDGRELVLSVEARKRDGDDYDPLQWLVGWYGLSYIWADASDVVGLRRLRWDRIIMDELSLAPDQIRQIFAYLSMQTNHLALHPRRYHSLIDNCTTALHDAFVAADHGLWWTASTIFSSSYRDYLLDRIQ